METDGNVMEMDGKCMENGWKMDGQRMVHFRINGKGMEQSWKFWVQNEWKMYGKWMAHPWKMDGHLTEQ